jgi:hypothetical protein
MVVATLVGWEMSRSDEVVAPGRVVELAVCGLRGESRVEVAALERVGERPPR